MDDNVAITRRTTDEGRVYILEDGDVYLPSVSTVIGQKPEPKGLTRWKNMNDGTGDSDHWEDILAFKASRGTLIHYELLNELIDGDMWGPEEQRSTEDLIDRGRYEEYQDDLAWAKGVWSKIREQRGITPESVLEVECFVIDTDVGFAGQFDLLYVDNEGRVVLSDMKTSKRVYPKHKLQLSAYANAVNIDVDMMEVIRLHPDSKDWETSHSTWWFESRHELFNEFVTLRESLNLDSNLEDIADEGRKG